jgi:hypothetical protein
VIRKIARKNSELRAAFRAAFDETSRLPEGRWEVIVRRYEAPKTSAQLALFGAIVSRVCDATGNDRETIRGLLKTLFLEPVRLPSGDFAVPSLELVSRRVMSGFLEKTIAWCATEASVYVDDLLEGYEPSGGPR